MKIREFWVEVAENSKKYKPQKIKSTFSIYVFPPTKGPKKFKKYFLYFLFWRHHSPTPPSSKFNIFHNFCCKIIWLFGFFSARYFHLAIDACAPLPSISHSAMCPVARIFTFGFVGECESRGWSWRSVGRDWKVKK